MVEDLDNYHLEEISCNSQCHTQKTLWIIKKGVECLILCLGKCCEKNYSSVRRYVAGPVNVYPKRSISDDGGGRSFLGGEGSYQGGDKVLGKVVDHGGGWLLGGLYIGFRGKRISKQRIEEFNLEELSPPIVTMDDQRTMAQLLQVPTEGYEDAIVVSAITADNFEGTARIWLEKEPSRSIFTWDDLVLKFINQFFPPSKTTNLYNEITNFQQRLDESFSEAWDRFKDLLRACPHHGFSELHQLDTFYNALNLKDQDSLNFAAGVSMNTSNFGISPDVAELKDMVKALLLDKNSQNQAPTTVKVVEESCVTYGGAHSYRNCPATDGNVYRDNIQKFVSQASTVNYNQGNTSYRPPMMSNQIRPPGFPPVPNKQNVQLNQRNNQNPYQAPAYQAPAPQTQGVLKEDFSAYVKANHAVMRNIQTQGQNMQNQLTNLTELFTKFVNSNCASTLSRATKDTVTPPNNGSTEDVQPLIVPAESLILNSEPVNSPIIEPVASSVSALKPNPKSSIPYPSRRNGERNREKANNQIEKFYQIFKDMSFEISFADALILMPKFTSTLKSLIGNKEKLSEMARTPLNEHCSVIGASINLIPLSVWKRLSLPELTLTCMTLELADRSISRPIGVAEDVYVKVGKFYFSADFVVVDFDADSRVPLILRRSFLKIGRALIDVFEGELTLRVGKKAITFNLDQTSRYSANYNDNSINQIDVIKMACEEYSQEFLRFSDVIVSGNLTPYYDPIVSTTSLTLTPFGNSDFLLEEVDAFLTLEDDPTSPEVDQSYHDSEGEILLLEAFLNDDPSLPPPNQGNYLPEVRKELKICEVKSDKSSIDEPPEVKLKDLPPHLEYAFMKSDNKLPVIIVKDLSIEEKTALIRVLKSHKRAIAWKLSDIKGYFQIPIDLKDHEKTIFTFPYRTFAYRRMPFGLCNALGTFQWCMMAIFHDIIEKTMEVFMDDFSVFEDSFQSSLLFRKDVGEEAIDILKACHYGPTGGHHGPNYIAKKVEVSNCGLKRILERIVDENRASWSDKLDDALWAF
uniref:Reverse transcriptase domain-containing protein n=1 Tax=Tanacetum cinerariifolium TaxID=118510 RepID=A0A6L2JF28_TANCI|nr:reverse transcriptase domain-containing protein [Tanacetum cinerariifolium]